MTLPENFEYAEVRGGLGRWCVRAYGNTWTLCGQTIHQVPAAEFQPVPEPGEVHDVCLRAVEELTSPPPPAPMGVCPACGQRVELVGGLIGRHSLCVGVNLKPKRGRR